MSKELLFVGLDVHAKNITIALEEGTRKDCVHAAGGGDSQGEARLYGTIANDLHALELRAMSLALCSSSATRGAVRCSAWLGVSGFIA